MENYTAAAISSPYGRGGVALIRASGADALAIAEKIFVPASGKALSGYPFSRAVYGEIVSEGKTVDDVMLTRYKAPHSYTGEDSFEITCHGGILVTAKVLEAVLRAGAKQAGPGEFTKRAFMNGKLSLTGAEAIINVIDAESEEALKLSRAQMGGSLSRAINAIYEDLLSVLSSVYVIADYPDEDLSELSRDDIYEKIGKCRGSLSKLLKTFETGHAITEGVRTAIVGEPNTGKSSLLNALCGEDRAIVTDVAGTTRDTIREKVRLERITLDLSDTAGIRVSCDPVEKIGVERSKAALRDAELVLCVFDAQKGDPSKEAIAELLSGARGTKIAVFNKCDLCPSFVPEKPEGFSAAVLISAKTGYGINQLKSAVEKSYVDGEINYETDALLTSVRQKLSVESALGAVNDALTALDDGFTPDVAGMDLESAVSYLGEVDGRAVSSEIVDRIFHRFCVGK